MSIKGISYVMVISHKKPKLKYQGSCITQLLSGRKQCRGSEGHDISQTEGAFDTKEWENPEENAHQIH
jgi:hypothetical protein